MTLATHAVVGSFVGAAAAANLPLAAVLGFTSHFLMDSIPHWDYPLASTHNDAGNELNNDMRTSGQAFALDLVKIGIDVVLGLGLVWLIFSGASLFILAGAFVGALFAMAPDALQFVYWKFRHEPLISLQKFHLYIHAATRLNKRPILGILSQIAIILVVAVISRHFFVYSSHFLW